MINILIVDDSNTESLLLKNLFEQESDFRVIGIAKNGKEAVELVAKLKPDIVTMDLQMPIMDGLEATRLIMSQHPVPIVVISAQLQNDELDMTFHALEAGALSVLEKPKDITATDSKKNQKRLFDTLRAMAGIRVVRRKFRKVPAKLNTRLPYFPMRHCEVIAIGASVGGPQALRITLSGLPRHFSVPIVVVQHMTPGFMDGFVKWLHDHLELQVSIAKEGEVLEGGKVYFAPDNKHLTVIRDEDVLRAKLVNSLPVSGFCPSITVLLNSVAEACGRQAVGVLLTGMGSDGAEGLLALQRAHGHTLVQDEKSAIVFGMGAVAQSLGAVDLVVELNKMASYLAQFG